MKDTNANGVIWKRIVFSAAATLLGVFFGTFVLAILVNCEIMSMAYGETGMYVLLFLASFISCFVIKSEKRQTYFTLLGALLAFVTFVILSMLSVYKFSVENTIIVLIILLASAIINSVVKAII